MAESIKNMGNITSRLAAHMGVGCMMTCESKADLQHAWCKADAQLQHRMYSLTPHCIRQWCHTCFQAMVVVTGAWMLV
jgi:hypothetical protein